VRIAQECNEEEERRGEERSGGAKLEL